MGGSENSHKSMRRVLLPILITGFAYLETESILTLTILSMILVLSIGYGIPDENDKGSKLGKLAFDFCKDRTLANILVRATITNLAILSLISIPIIKGNWQQYYYIGQLYVLLMSLISWRDLGTYKLFSMKLLWVDTIVYFLLATSAICLIKV